MLNKIGQRFFYQPLKRKYRTLSFENPLKTCSKCQDRRSCRGPESGSYRDDQSKAFAEKKIYAKFEENRTAIATTIARVHKV